MNVRQENLEREKSRLQRTLEEERRESRTRQQQNLNQRRKAENQVVQLQQQISGLTRREQELEEQVSLNILSLGLIIFTIYFIVAGE